MKTSTFIDRLKSLRVANGRNSVFHNLDLYKLLLKDDSLLAGYEMIKSNKGATTPSIDNASLDGFSRLRLEKLRTLLRNEAWRPRPARRIYIPKPGKTTKRPLGIQGPEEKVVQATMLLILEAIYEPRFCDSSFGFRPKLGCHDALRLIGHKFDGMTFAIEGDIVGMFDNVNHRTLVSLLERRIKDDRFIRLVWKMLNAGYLDTNGQIMSPEVGTPQGSIVSPILANIYLHELDLFMEKRVQKVTLRNPKVRTPEYRLLDNRMKVIKSRLGKPLPEDQRLSFLKELRALKIQSLETRMYTKPSVRIHYTRYADDFIIGIAGSYQLCMDLRNEVGIFLTTLGLSLSPEKTKITDLRKDAALFLGHNITIHTSVKFAYVRPKGSPRYLKRVTGALVKIQAPLKRIVQRLALKGFCSTSGHPQPKKLWLNQEDNQIVLHYENTIRGIFGFYSGVDNRRYLQQVWYILKYSCAYTLANKHRCSLKKIFTKHGNLLSVNYGKTGERSVCLTLPSFKEESKRWQVGRVLPDPYRNIAARVSRTKIDENCCICGAPSSQMHHIRHVKDAKTGFTLRIMGLINRKQIPVCLDCHQSIHSGKYDGISLKEFVNPQVATR